jgi:GNAT superfamily N-acetyltransferase
MSAKLFKSFAVAVADGGTAVFSINEDVYIDSVDDAITWHMLSVYGIDGTDEDYEKIYDNDFSSASQIGTILLCHISCSLITNLGDDPYTVCDDSHSDLESMYSVIREYEDDFIDYIDDIYYIHEIELDSEYQGKGYEKILLQQLPAIIVKTMHTFPSLLIYYPRPTGRDEPELDLEAEAILRHRMNYFGQTLYNDENNNNISLFPPLQTVPEKEINRQLGRRNSGDSVPKKYRDQELYKLYNVSFVEFCTIN